MGGGAGGRVRQGLKGGVSTAPLDGMKENLDAESCRARARRLTAMADEAADYDLILTYDALAMEWLELAARCPPAPAPVKPFPAPSTAVRPRRKRFWFL